MWQILAVAVGCALLSGCSSDNSETVEPPPPHPDGGMPLVFRDASSSSNDAAARENLQLIIRGRKNGREGCAYLFLSDVPLANFSQRAHWAAFPPSGVSDNETRLRSGNYRLEQITSEYPQFAELSLQFYIQGNLTSTPRVLHLDIQNISLQNNMPSSVFLTPLYETWSNQGQTINCKAKDDFSNEFFVQTSNHAAELSLNTTNSSTDLCRPCGNNIDYISVEIQN